MTEETFQALLAFLETGTTLPRRVTNAMLLMALRLEREGRQRNDATTAAILAGHERMLVGQPPEAGRGLLGRVARLERVSRMAQWVILPVASAFLGALGAALWAGLFGVVG